jgi:hypothetical protein
MTTKKFDPALRRRMYWANHLKTPSACPECDGALTTEAHVYAIAAQEKGEITTFASSNEGGHFCAHCPVVVLDNAVFNEITKESPAITRFQVMGIIDVEHTTDRDIAIAEFLTDKPAVRPHHVVRSHHADKIGRNDLCPCNSGKKYKKCCMPH